MNKAKSLLDNINGVPFIEAVDNDEDDEKKIPAEVEGDDFSDLSYDDTNTEKEDKPDEFTQSVLDILKHSKDPDEDFDADQLAEGMKVEAEHTDNKWVQKAIAKAHLAEHPEYYKALAAMEEELKKKEKESKAEEDELDV